MQETDPQILYDQARTAERIHRDYTKALHLYEIILARTPSNTSPDHKIRLLAREKYGDLLSRLGQQQEALAEFEAYRQEAQTPTEKTTALSLIGSLLSSMGRLSEAFPVLQEALLIAQDLDRPTQALDFMGMGNALYESDRLDEALKYFEKAIPGFVESGDREHQLRVYNWQGMAFTRLGYTDQAIKAFQEGLLIARKVGNRAASILLNSLGEAYQNLFDMEQALVYHKEGMELAESTNLASNMADLTRNLGVDLMHLGQLEEGLAYLYRALSLSEESGRTTVKLQSLYSLSLVEGKLQNLEMAKTHAQVLLELAREKYARVHEAEALYAMGVCHKLSGEIAQADQLWQQASFLAHETEQRMLLWQIHAAMAEVATQPGLGDVHRRIAAEVIEQIAHLIGDKKLREKLLNAPQVKSLLAASAG